MRDVMWTDERMLRMVDIMRNQPSKGGQRFPSLASKINLDPKKNNPIDRSIGTIRHFLPKGLRWGLPALANSLLLSDIFKNQEWLYDDQIESGLSVRKYVFTEATDKNPNRVEDFCPNIDVSESDLALVTAAPHEIVAIENPGDALFALALVINSSFLSPPKDVEALLNLVTRLYSDLSEERRTHQGIIDYGRQFCTHCHSDVGQQGRQFTLFHSGEHLNANEPTGKCVREEHLHTDLDQAGFSTAQEHIQDSVHLLKLLTGFIARIEYILKKRGLVPNASTHFDRFFKETSFNCRIK